MADDVGQEQTEGEETPNFRDKARETSHGKMLRGQFSSSALASASEKHPAFDFGMRKGWGDNL